MRAQVRAIEEMRHTIQSSVGAQHPYQILKKNAEMIICFIRGFADEHHDIVLISERSDSQSMNIIEVKNINEMRPLC